MDEQKLHEKLDIIIKDVNEVKMTQVKHQASLDHHIYRTELAEENIELLRKDTKEEIKSLKKDIEPLKTFKNNLYGAFKWSLVVITTAGVIIGALKLFLK